MVATGYSTLKRNSALGIVMTVALAGCTSVEYAPQHQLAATQKPAPAIKAAATETGYAAPEGGAVATAQALPGVAQTGASQQPGQQQAMATTAVTKSARVGQPAQTLAAQAPSAQTALAAQPQSGSEAMSVAFAEMPLTDEVTAIQSVIPMKRPDAPYRQQDVSPQLAYAAAPAGAARAFSSMNSLSEFDTRPAQEIESRMAASLPEESPKSRGGPAVDNQMLKTLISKYAALYQVPESLVHRVVKRESTYNPKAYSNGNYGLMQIRYNTAKGMGYKGPASGLFDAETNLKYAVKYLRGAWLTADTDHDGAVRLYASGYYYTAKRKGLLNQVQ